MLGGGGAVISASGHRVGGGIVAGEPGAVGLQDRFVAADVDAVEVRAVTLESRQRLAA